MNTKKYIIIITVVLVLVGSVFWMLRKKTNEPLKVLDNQVEQAAVKLEIEKKNDIEVMKRLDIALDIARETDKDLDGLSNEEEKKLGTNPESSDTDSDGILDGDEIQSYHTDPLKADTDGDGYKDGYEVERGYSPIGPGKLIK